MIRALIVLTILILFLSSNYTENTNNKQKTYTPGTNYKKHEISKKQSELTKEHEREVYACFLAGILERYHNQISDFVINYNSFWDYRDEGTEVHYSYRYNNVEQSCAGTILFTPYKSPTSGRILSMTFKDPDKQIKNAYSYVNIWELPDYSKRIFGRV